MAKTKIPQGTGEQTWSLERLSAEMPGRPGVVPGGNWNGLHLLSFYWSNWSPLKQEDSNCEMSFGLCFLSCAWLGSIEGTNNKDWYTAPKVIPETLELWGHGVWWQYVAECNVHGQAWGSMGSFAKNLPAPWGSPWAGPLQHPAAASAAAALVCMCGWSFSSSTRPCNYFLWQLPGQHSIEITAPEEVRKFLSVLKEWMWTFYVWPWLVSLECVSLLLCVLVI